ncbi:MAG TPA: alpha/beta hydrolase [Candidatus Dormibacteraeota bacterium]|jgi:pimeloyl-ACP methyl ester carboxylesterase
MTTKNGYIEANGINYYYEVHGKGEPLLLLHGGLGSIDMFGPLLATLAEGREVIAVDLHGHGRTALGDRSVSIVDIGDDMAVIVRRLGHKQVDAMGYSFGGGVAFRLAVQHPEMVRRLVIVSAGFSTEGFHAEMRPMQGQLSAASAEFMKDTPMYTSYAAVAPHPEDFPKLLDRMGEFMREAYDFSEDAKKLKMPVMLVFGDSDMFTTPHVAEFYNLIGGNVRDAGWQRENMSQNRLAILPDSTHYDIFVNPELARTALAFLNGQSRTQSWGQQIGEPAGKSSSGA